MVTERTSQLLSSYDIELVRLGTVLLRNEVPRREWKRILSQYRNREFEEEGTDQTNYGLWRQLPTWNFEILENNDIEIVPINTQNYGYSGFSGTIGYSGRQPTYTMSTGTTIIHTGEGGLKLIQRKIEDLLYNKQKKQIKNGNKQKTKQKISWATNNSKNGPKFKSRETRAFGRSKRTRGKG